MTSRTATSPQFPAITTLEQLAHAYPELTRRVLRYLLARCDVDHAAAEDAAHDAIEDIARRVLRGEPIKHPLTFACTWARNAVRNEQRAAARLADRLTTGRPYGRIRIERRARVDDEQRHALRDQLTPTEYGALELRLRGLTVEQAAASLAIPRSTYTSRLQRAHTRLRGLARGS
jgi:RNA polymerase sigma factor (sigma-70 family)